MLTPSIATFSLLGRPKMTALMKQGQHPDPVFQYQTLYTGNCKQRHHSRGVRTVHIIHVMDVWSITATVCVTSGYFKSFWSIKCRCIPGNHHGRFHWHLFHLYRFNLTGAVNHRYQLEKISLGGQGKGNPYIPNKPFIQWLFNLLELNWSWPWSLTALLILPL